MSGGKWHTLVARVRSEDDLQVREDAQAIVGRALREALGVDVLYVDEIALFEQVEPEGDA